MEPAKNRPSDDYLVEGFMSGSLSAEEIAEFERRQSTDQEFADRIEMIHSLLTIKAKSREEVMENLSYVDEDIDDSTLSSADKATIMAALADEENKRKKGNINLVTVRWIIAASIALLIVFLSLFYNSAKGIGSYELLADQYVDYKHYTLNRSEAIDEEDNYFHYYASRNANDALSIYEESDVLRQDSLSLYQGILSLNENEIEAALDYFQRFNRYIRSNNVISEDASFGMWYYGLTQFLLGVKKNDQILVAQSKESILLLANENPFLVKRAKIIELQEDINLFLESYED